MESHISGRARSFFKTSSPVRIISVSFAFLIIMGTIAFMLPIATRDGAGLPFIKALFTSTSATCVTGLTLIDPYLTLTTFGQVVLLLLIQMGGLGLVTLTSFFLLTFSKRVGLKSLKLAQVNTNAFSISNTRSLMRTIITTTIIIEIIGAAMLCTSLIPKFGPEGIWLSLFTAVSAYCNAGFDLFGSRGEFSSLTTFYNDPVVMYTIMLLIILGGLGFIVFQDLITWRRGHHLMLHTKIVICVTTILIFLGAILFFLSEYGNPESLGSMTLMQKITNSLFQSVTTRTAGFASVNIGALNDMTKALMIVWMFIGAGPGSTGGGIKVTTIAILIMTVVSVIRGYDDTIMFHRRVDRKNVYKAIAIIVLSIAIVGFATIVIFFSTPPVNGINGVFEVVSAFATVGLTANTTLILHVVGQCAIILTMFIGRVGPVSFALSFVAKNEGQQHRGEVLPEGKVIVG